MMTSIDSLQQLTIPAGVEGVIFDYGGTLDTRGDHWSHIIFNAYKECGFDLSKEDLREAYVYAERTLAGSPLTITPADTFRDLMRKKIAIQMGCLYNRDSIALSRMPKSKAIADRCYDYARVCTAESAKVLSHLAADYPLALVSNFYGNLNAVLEDFGLRGYFKAVIESAVVGIRKPDPAIYRMALDALGLPPGKVLMVGDSLGKDILPAESLGCHTVLLKGYPWEAD